MNRPVRLWIPYGQLGGPQAVDGEKPAPLWKTRPGREVFEHPPAAVHRLRPSPQSPPGLSGRLIASSRASVHPREASARGRGRPQNGGKSGRTTTGAGPAGLCTARGRRPGRLRRAWRRGADRPCRCRTAVAGRPDGTGTGARTRSRRRAQHRTGPRAARQRPQRAAAGRCRAEGAPGRRYRMRGTEKGPGSRPGPLLERRVPRFRRPERLAGPRRRPRAVSRS
jgi:hypothetical protein